jgi:GDP-L-fucose synthase
MDLNDKIYVAGHNGLVGAAIVRLLKKEGFSNIVTRSSSELDLRNNNEVVNFFEAEKPSYVFLAAAKVGGILANKNYPASFIYDNLCIQNNVIHTAYESGVKKMLFLGSSCIYPKNAPQPINESYLLSSYLEETNEPYAVAKIAGIKMCQSYSKQYGCNFISVMPPNLYGPGDNYDLENAHVLPALLRRFHEAKMRGEKSVVVWGTGKPMREFLFVDDAARACLFLMKTYNSPDIINIGPGLDHSIMDTANLIKKIIGFEGDINFDLTKPDGTFRKVLQVDKIKELGWQSQIDFETGLNHTYQDFSANYEYYIKSKKERQGI